MDISGELCSLSGLDMLTGQAVERVLSVSGWDGERRNPAKQWATTWRRGDAHAWIQGDGPVQVEFTLWRREVEDERPDPDTYIDELYDAAIVRPVVAMSRNVLWKVVDVEVIDGAVNGTGGVVETGAAWLRRLQTGSVRVYAASLMVGVVLVLGYYIWRYGQMTAF